MYNKEYSLGKNIITEGTGDLLIYGYPFDRLIKRDEKFKKDGRDFAPDCLRRFLPFLPTISSISSNFLNPKSHSTNLANFKIRDLGNYEFPESLGKKKWALSKQTLSVDEVLEEDFPDNLSEIYGYDIPLLLLSSTKETLYSQLKAIYLNENLQNQNQNKVGLICISQELDLRDLYNDYNLHSGCCQKKFIRDFEPLKSNLNFFQNFVVEYFGVNEDQVNKDEWEFAKQNSDIIKNVQTIRQIRKAEDENPGSLDRDSQNKQLKRSFGYDCQAEPSDSNGMDTEGSFPQTSVGKQFKKLLQNFEGTVDEIYVLQSIEALEVFF